ncbi:Internalin-I [Wickerhamomyces ciferrii]|uniref:Internalin-I n=1 Tax=Wickerhamomyces ciferrii (strain ATCC 14091 / BCRC 22168 / CBS 111 / JCM 3599 / NBRC 0793 / NRRL Y-1031 F-60-10) TaxID=1206466 RepID=K0KJ78_WICCF|nr:Internalin-I [Wickerhamomyces ciferrii]CCH41168.1 Internalin-I [Wickerhamomyces ciferrii]
MFLVTNMKFNIQPYAVLIKHINIQSDIIQSSLGIWSNIMNFTGFPPEIQRLIFQYSYPSDLLNIVQNVPELKHLITSDAFKIVTNDVPNLKLKYGLSDDFFLDYKCSMEIKNIESEADYFEYNRLSRDYFIKERNNRVLDPSLLKGFKGAILIEIYDVRTMLNKFDYHLLKHDPIEIYWHSSRVDFDFFTNMFGTSGQRLKKINILLRTENEFDKKLKDKDHEKAQNDQPYEVYDVSDIPRGIPSNVLQIPFAKSLYLDELEGYSIPGIRATVPDLEKINITFDHEFCYDPNIYLDEEDYEFNRVLGFLEDGRKKSKLTEFFETNMERPLDFLKYFQLKYFHNKKFKLFDNLQVSNLEKLVIDSSSIHSINNLDLPKLRSLDIKNSAIYEISNLKLDSIINVSIDLSSPHHVLKKKQMKHINFTIENIQSSTLENFNLTSSFKINKISNLGFPSLKAAKINSTTFSYSHLDTFGNILKTSDKLETIILTNTIEILKSEMTFPKVKTLSIKDSNELGKFDISNIESSFPELENLKIEGIPLDDLYHLFHIPSNLQTINISSCPDFNISKIGSQNSLRSLVLKNMKSISGFSGISLPLLTKLEIETSGKNHHLIQNCSFKILKALKIATKFTSPMTYDEFLTFLNNDIPQLENLVISGYTITNHFSTEPYPLLVHLKIDRIESIEISPSQTLKSLNLSQNFTTIDLNKSDELPNLKEYKEPKKKETLGSVLKKKKVYEEELDNMLKALEREKKELDRLQNLLKMKRDK